MVDDLIAYVTGPDELLLVPNAANAAAVAAALDAAAPEGVVVRDRHHDLAVLALQGPRADEVLAAAGVPGRAGLHGLRRDRGRRRARSSSAAPATPASAATSCSSPSAAATAVWDALVAAGAPSGLRPAGLGARDTLRTEMGYPLHGQDLSLDDHRRAGPARAGPSGGRKPTFQGDEALRAEKEAGPTRVLRGLRADGPRHPARRA